MFPPHRLVPELGENSIRARTETAQDSNGMTP